MCRNNTKASVMYSGRIPTPVLGSVHLVGHDYQSDVYRVQHDHDVMTL